MKVDVYNLLAGTVSAPRPGPGLKAPKAKDVRPDTAPVAQPTDDQKDGK